MFSKCIILVEGDTEFGAVPEFANRMGLDLDFNGIGVIKLDGADSIKNCMQIYQKFGIKAIAIIDRDKYENYKDMEDVYFTNKIDFEEDVYDEFSLTDFMNYKYEIGKIKAMIGILKEKGIQIDASSFEQNYSEYVISQEVQEEIMKEIREEELNHMKKQKNVHNAFILAKHVTKIPESFINVIQKVKEEVV